MIGLTDNGTFEENCLDEVNNIFVLNLINGDKMSSEKGDEKFININWEKEENFCVYVMVKNRQLWFKVNNGEYKNGFNLTKDNYWFYIEKNNAENNTNSTIQLHLNNNTNSEVINEEYSSKIKFIYVRKI